ncbi:organic hydroperoxide resistance protein [Enterovirga aerilata]|uniref:Organic hydroperoxide resistance protein n=1 Tax=Enterovirga aerilata TaxID=2730920 RepID=A0A849HVM2_9HYPH|nr:organic hydroperoxide resistance protein [Enterovirga sp. DB1703]NNM71586.1 organic hydroperoxide resistance protein [Enterovirga sp. DB1703]
MKVIYTAEAVATGGRNGTARSSDGELDLRLARPKEMGGPGGGTNPEQLFAVGYAACFASTMDHLARQQKLDIGTPQVTAKVGLAMMEGGAYGITAELLVSLPALPEDQARALLEQAHRTCPYSNATRGNVDVKLTLAR